MLLDSSKTSDASGYIYLSLVSFQWYGVWTELLRKLPDCGTGRFNRNIRYTNVGESRLGARPWYLAQQWIVNPTEQGQCSSELS